MLPFRKIGIFALSRTPDAPRMEAGLRTLHAWGIRTELPVLKPCRYLATTDADGFNRQLAGYCDALLAACGGYGALRLLEQIDFELLARRKIPVIGYSDVCALHLAAFRRGAQFQIHGPMLCNHFGDISDFTLAGLQRCLSGANPFEGVSLTVLKPGTVTAPVVASNLAILCSLLGTRFMPDLSGCILVLEDIGEAAYRIDRMLTQLRLAGALADVRGLVFGSFSDCEDSEYLPDILEEAAGFIDGPVASGLPFGHCRDTLSFRIGSPATLALSR